MRVWLCITRPEASKHFWVGLNGKSNHTTEETRDVETLTTENMNGVELYNGGATIPTTGKRKERSPSP